METGNAEALNNVGWYYHNGIGVGADYAKALEYYTEAIRKGSVDALEEMGELYRDGLGVEQDYEKAADYFHKLPGLLNVREQTGQAPFRNLDSAILP